MKDKYFHKKEKLANLLFDLVKYLLTTLGAIMLLSEKTVKTSLLISVSAVTITIFIIAIYITPLKEDET
jgi:Ca2+/Na+ antiporter